MNTQQMVGGRQEIVRRVRSRGATSASAGVLARIRLTIDREEEGNVAEAARRAGVSARGLQKVISGQTRDPRLSMLVKFADAYHLDPTWLMTGSAAGTSPDIERAAARRAQEIVRALAVQAAESISEEATVTRYNGTDRPAASPYHEVSDR